MKQEAYNEVSTAAVKKMMILKNNPAQYMLRAVLASIYIGFAVMLTFRLGEPFYDSGSPAASLFLSGFFGIALILIIYGGAELFTGNTMFFTMSTIDGKTTIKNSLTVLAVCYGGNLAGALVFGLLIGASGIYNEPQSSQYIMDVVSNKMSFPVSELFFKAILCNWIVCLAVWIPMQVKGDLAKMVVIMLSVMTFVVSGFEHSVANMVLFSVALIVPHPETITMAGAVYNLIPVTVGNLIGGSVFVGMVNAYLAKTPENQGQDKTNAKYILHLSKSRRS